MKHLICLLAITLAFYTPAYAAKVEKKTVIVDKKPIKQKVRKELQSGKKKCYSAYDKKSKRKNKSYVICEGGK